MLTRSPSFPLVGFGFAGFVGLVTMGCVEEGEYDPFDRSGSLIGNPEFVGEFAIQQADYHDGTSRRYNILFSEGQQVEVELPEGTEILRESIVRAFGEYDDDGVLQVDDFDVLSFPPQHTWNPEPRMPRRVAAVAVHWSGAHLNNAALKDKMFLSDDSTNVYYQEVSYAMETIAGDAFGPYEIANPGGCVPQTIKSFADSAFKAKGHDPEEFRQFMYFFPGAGCSWAGLANIGTPDNPARDTWYNSASGCVVRAQELGHNYGMGHSHRYEGCTVNAEAAPFGDDCSHVEYGHPYDPMGAGCGHMNVTQKAYMGWLEECNIVTTEVDGLYNIAPVELPCNGAQALRFPTGEGNYYYLEYRQPMGSFDGPKVEADGVLVVVAGGHGNLYGPANWILDMHDGPGAYMQAGDSYTDYNDAVTFTVVETTAERAVIQLEFPGGGSGSPTCDGGGDPGSYMGAVGAFECAEEPIPLDVDPPVVVITYPEDEEYFEPGSSFWITAEVTDDRAVTEVELYVDGEPTFKDFDPPWEYHVENIPQGSYNFGVVARDGPNQGLSMSVDIHVVPGGGPMDTGETGVAETTGDESGTESDTDGDDSGATSDGGGCSCRTSTPATPVFAMLGLLAAFGWRRRFWIS